MKKLLVVLVTVLAFNLSNAQKIVFTSGDFTTTDAIRMVESGYSVSTAISQFKTYEGYLILDNGIVNGHDLKNLDNVLQLFTYCKEKTRIETEYYIIKKGQFGSSTVIFKDNLNKKYTVTRYLSKIVTKAISKYTK